ncbi:MAG: hypothetical protein F4Z31_02095 [Gemmatimonadetes bacterium]|nr:hypothetical protein [Gemmatimonadota bacterium]
MMRLRRRTRREWSEKGAFVDDWVTLRNKEAPGRSRQERRRRLVIGALLVGLSPVPLGSCLVSSSASSTADEALDAAVRAEAVAAAVELPVARHVASARLARWAEESGLGPIAMTPSGWRRVDGEACNGPGAMGLEVAPGSQEALEPEVVVVPEVVCELHAFRVVPATSDGSWELETTVLVNVASGAASGVYAEFAQPPPEQNLLTSGRPEVMPERLEELLKTWALAWVANDTAVLRDLANDVAGELALPTSGAPEGWVLDEQEGVRLLQEAGAGNPFSVLVEFRVIPPAKTTADTTADGYEALIMGLEGSGGEGYEALMSGLDDYAAATLSVPVTAEVSVLVEGSLARIVGWGPVGSPSDRVGAER